jgi:hypothetical protein
MSYLQMVREFEARRAADEPWDEIRASESRAAIFGWASRETPPGCWAWAYEHRPDLVRALNGALLALDMVFVEPDTRRLNEALVRFGEIVRSAVKAYRKEACRPEQHRARWQQREALALSNTWRSDGRPCAPARTARLPAEAPC